MLKILENDGTEEIGLVTSTPGQVKSKYFYCPGIARAFYDGFIFAAS